MPLELIDLGTYEGGTYLIHPRIYDGISSSDIVLIDMTGIRPNVCLEAGFALEHHNSGRLIFIWQKGHGLPDIPFDLSTFRYEAFEEAAQIPSKIIPHIEAIIQESKTIN